MKLLKEVIKQRSFLLFALVAIVGIVALTLQKPMEAYAVTNPGLDSGNAQVTTVGSDTVLTYKTTGTSTFKAPAGVTNVRVVVIGGGGGGASGGGGGGAGRMVSAPSVPITPGVSQTITVGGGGTAGTSNANGGNGGSSSIGTLVVAPGGGGGGGYSKSGLNGGSGGGKGRDSTGGSAGLGNQTGTVPAGGTGRGNNGGTSNCTSTWCGGGGGGGGGAVGGNGFGNGAQGSEIAGPGGNGSADNITGTSVTYAGGGGGGYDDTANGAAGGSGGAGGGSSRTAAANTGSGGGGTGYNLAGGAGGSGIVVVRFATQNVSDQLGMTGLRMWYKADATGNTNALWKDSSGLGYDITQGTAGKQPVLTQGAINFNPAYVFDGTDDAFSMPAQGIIGTDPMSAFYGATASRTDGGYRFFEEFGDDTPSISMNNGKPDLYVGGTSPQQLTYSSVQALVPHVYSFISPNANNQPRIVGVDDNEQSQNVTMGLYTTSSGSQTGNTFGGTNGSSGTSWAGPMAEALYFNRVLTSAERLKIASYLAIKYGVTRYQGTSGAGYADSAGTTIWPADSTFKNNIAGIGRDDTMTLNQKQSKSTSDGDIVTIGHGAIATTNQANTNNFGVDKAFLLWGHNGAATNQNTTVSGAYLRMNRIWKAVRTTAMGSLKIRVPKSAVTQGSNGVMYTSTSTTFDASAQKITMTDLGTEYEATLTTLPASTFYFSFGSLAGSDIQFVNKTATNIGGSTVTSYIPGEPIEYRLTVKNNGPDNAGTVTVTDTLPTGIVPTATGSSGGGWTCNVSSQTVTCTRPALNTNATAPDITIEATIASNVTGAKNNTATASVSNDPDLSNNSASLNLPPAPKADLSITKAHSGTPTAGSPLTYNFTVKNNGPSDVASFKVTDTLDTNLTYTSSSPNICSAAAQVVTCNGAALADGATATFSMVVTVSPSYVSGAISNTGTVAVPAGTTDPNSANNSSTDATNVFVSTELGITKTHTGNFTAGANNDFKITVDNQGPSNAAAGTVTITDTLDEDFSFVSANSPGGFWDCSESGGTVTCTNTTTAITAGGAAPDLTLTVLVDAVAKGSTANTAEVSSTSPDPDLSDNSSTNNVTIDSEADLGITKAHVGTAFTAGTQEQYTFTVINNGPSVDSPSYTISDTLPASLSFVGTVAGSAATCSAVAQVVTCTGGDVTVGETQVTTINVAVSGSATGTIANTATVATPAGVTDPTPGNNTSNDNVNVEPNADLSITKAPATDMTAGSNATYNFTVHNGGPSNVSGFTVTDTLDSNFTYVSSSPNICSVTGTGAGGAQIVTCTDTTGITNGNDSPFSMTVSLESTAAPGSTIANTATVTPPTGVNDPNSANNSGSVNRNVVASADLEITKSHTGNFTAGTEADYTIVVTNNGPSDASAFTVTDTLPTGLTFVSGSNTAGVNASCMNAGQIVTCTGGPVIGASQTSTITLTVMADRDLAGNTTLDNAASVSSTTPDPDTSNNTSPTDTATVDSKADLDIRKVHTSDFTAGNTEDYQIEVINHGPSDASGFTVSDTLPTGLTYVSSSPNICSAVGQVVTCNGGALAGDDSSTVITITVNTSASLTAGTTIDNTASVVTIAPTTDPDSTNNDSTDTATIVNVTDLSIAKGHTGTFIAGGTGKYTFAVTNSGPSNTPTGDVQVLDTLPAGMTYASYIGTGWDCTGSSGANVTCTYAPSLAAGPTPTPTLTVTVNIPADTPQGDVINTGTVVSTLDDSDPADDSDSDTVTITAEADLTATKTPVTSPIVAGQSVTYRFTVENNTGPSDATEVKITDNNPDLTYQSVSSSDWDCTANGTDTACTYDQPLAVGATQDVDITFKLAEDAPSPFENTASVTFNGTDPTPANPTTSDPLSYSADLEVDITHDKQTYHGGDTINYTYTVINHGPSAATDAVLTSTIPNGLTVQGVSATEPGGDSILAKLDSVFFARASVATNPFSCHLNGQQLTCNAPTLLIGTYKLYLTAKIATSFTGQLVTTAHITSATPDPNLSDTNATDTISNVLPASGLARTGQNIILWTVAALLLIAAGITVRRIRRQSAN